MSRINNMVAYKIICLTLSNIDRDKSSIMNDSFFANELFAFNNDEDYEVKFPLALPLVQMEQQKELNQSNSKLKVDI